VGRVGSRSHQAIHGSEATRLHQGAGKYFPGRSAKDITEMDVERWAISRRPPVGNRTFNIELATIGQSYKYQTPEQFEALFHPQPILKNDSNSRLDSRGAPH
jgi:hypothetical protein